MPETLEELIIRVDQLTTDFNELTSNFSKLCNALAHHRGDATKLASEYAVKYTA